jgi:hypothetical protein
MYGRDVKCVSYRHAVEGWASRGSGRKPVIRMEAGE